VSLTVALVGCGKQKLAVRATARELYTGALFRKALAYALTLTPRAYVLSALHGVVDLEQELDPYELSMAGVEDPDAWAVGATHDLARLLDQHRRGREPLRLVVLAGAAYADPMKVAAERWGWGVEEPLRGLQQGPRLRWLNDRLGTATRRTRSASPARRSSSR
jgi:hypothetical protein